MLQQRPLSVSYWCFKLLGLLWFGNCMLQWDQGSAVSSGISQNRVRWAWSGCPQSFQVKVVDRCKHCSPEYRHHLTRQKVHTAALSPVQSVPATTDTRVHCAQPQHWDYKSQGASVSLFLLLGIESSLTLEGRSFEWEEVPSSWVRENLQTCTQICM